MLFAVPNLLPAHVRADLPSWLPHRAMTLGLDLQGGSYLLLEVDGNALRKERADSLREDVRNLLREKHMGYTGCVPARPMSSSACASPPSATPRWRH